MNLFTKQKQSDAENNFMVTREERQGDGKIGNWDLYTHIAMYETDD